MLSLLVLTPAMARAEERILPEKAWMAKCIAERASPATARRTARAYCGCMTKTIGALTDFDNLTVLVRTWPPADAYCRRSAGVR
jgi:hypothetical protein